MSRLAAFLRGRLWLWELSAIAWLLLLPYVMTAHGHLDVLGHALGRDFVNFWTAGQLIREGHPLIVFNPDDFLAAEHRLFDPGLSFHFWSYPPPALLLVAPLGLLPYLPALVLWSIVGLVVLLPAARRFLTDPRYWVLLLAAPATAIDVALGQNGAITAAILIGGLALWPTRPILAGALLGLLIFKPQIALLLPVAVLAEGRWRIMLAAAASALGLCLLSTLLFGVEAWRGFLGPAMAMQQTVLTEGVGPFQWLMPSTFMAGRLLGLPITVAVALQALASLWAVGLVWAGWRSSVDHMTKAALLMMATFVASPQAFAYDLIPAACAALLLWRRDDGWSRIAALAVWGLPAFMLAAQSLQIDIAPIVLIVASWRLYRLCRPSRNARASTPGELASNT